MLISTTESIAGHRTATTLGQVFGVVVRSCGLRGRIIGGLRTLIGGEIPEYTAHLEQARRQAIDRLMRNAAEMGANAVIAVGVARYDSSTLGQSMTEILASGTAIVVEPLPSHE
jgi:uncharacterized protein YbjQ (UPF0145 family)